MIPVPDTNRPNAQLAFSAGARQQLALAIEYHLAAPPSDPHDGLAAAIERLRIEAREQRIGAEQVVLALQTIWLSHPARRHHDPNRKSLAYYQLIDECLSLFFGER
jgi:hypothetical protein